MSDNLKESEFDENKYPMTYKEFEKRVIELFLQNYQGEGLRIMKKRVDDELKNDPNFIETLYGQTCFIYESPHLYGENCKNAFEDFYLMSVAVHNLVMFL